MTGDMVIASDLLCIAAALLFPSPLVILALLKEGRKIDTSITLKKRVTKVGIQSVQQETICCPSLWQ